MFIRIINGEPVLVDLETVRREANAALRGDASDAQLAELGVYRLEKTPMPEASIFEIVSNAPPIFQDGVWREAYTITPQPPETAQAIFEAEKDRLHEAVNELRNDKEENVAPTPFGPVDTDPKSSKRLLAMQAVAMAALIVGAPWQNIEWTMADNSVILLDTPQKGLQLAAAATSYGSQLHAAAKAIKLLIGAVEWDPQDPHAALAELRAIDIEEGWPQ